MKYSFRYKMVKMLDKIGIGFDASKSEAVKNMKKTIAALDGGKIIFNVTVDENGDWAAEATNLDGLITGGYSTDNFNDMIVDAIFTYFNIPPKYCDDSLLLKKSTSKKSKERKMFAFAPGMVPATA